MRCTAGDRKIHSELVVGLAIGRAGLTRQGPLTDHPQPPRLPRPSTHRVSTMLICAPRPGTRHRGFPYHRPSASPLRTYRIERMFVETDRQFELENLRRSIAMLRVGAPALDREAAMKLVRELQALEGQIRRLRAGMQRSWTILGPDGGQAGLLTLPRVCGRIRRLGRGPPTGKPTEPRLGIVGTLAPEIFAQPGGAGDWCSRNAAGQAGRLAWRELYQYARGCSSRVAMGRARSGARGD